MHNALATLLAAAWLAVAVPAVAQPTQARAATPSTPSSAASFTDGEVRKVDRSAARITLKHGEIKNLDMPAMTMAFGVKDASLLDQVNVGDKIRFQAVNDGGKLTLTQIQRAK